MSVTGEKKVYAIQLNPKQIGLHDDARILWRGVVVSFMPMARDVGGYVVISLDGIPRRYPDPNVRKPDVAMVRHMSTLRHQLSKAWTYRVPAPYLRQAWEQSKSPGTIFIGVQPGALPPGSKPAEIEIGELEVSYDVSADLTDFRSSRDQEATASTATRSLSGARKN